MKSSFGKNIKVTIEGGSHEKEMNIAIKGLPQDTLDILDMDKLQNFVNRRVPGSSNLSTPRKETDKIILKDKLIKKNSVDLYFAIENKNYKSEDYTLKYPRPSHADLPAFLKYGDKVNMAGGGPFSGRMTAMLCIAGGIAIQLLENKDIHIGSQILSIGQMRQRGIDMVAPQENPINDLMTSEIEFARDSKNSVGGIIEGFVTGLPVGIGGPMYDGLESVLSPILFAMPGVKGVEFGNGFASSYILGSENNDDILNIEELTQDFQIFGNENLTTQNYKILTATNNHGGILGGLTTGMPLIARVAFKPTPTIEKPQQTINLETGKQETHTFGGRHDPCIVLRALPIVEAALAIALLDAYYDFEKYNSEKQENVKKVAKSNFSDNMTLTALRNEIDELDEMIVDLLNKRMDISKKVAITKKDTNTNIENSAREDEILRKVGAEFEDIYKAIFTESKRAQERIMKGE